MKLSKQEARILRKLKAFKETLDDPDQCFISGSEARREFGLSKADMKELTSSFVKECPYESQKQSGILLPQYHLADVTELAKRKLGEAKVIEHYHRYLLLQAKDPHGDQARIQRQIFGGLSMYKSRWYSAPSTTTMAGQESVRQGLISNTMICTVKGAVWWYTGSHAIFADLMHSAADVANYSYRIVQLNKTVQNPDLMHPYGYAPLRYITADRSFVILAGLGFAVPFSHSFSEFFAILYHNHSATVMSPDMIGASALVFGISMALEGVAVRTAYHEILSQAMSGMGPGDSQELSLTPWKRCYRYILEGPDVMSVATFTESASGVVGAGVGLSGLALSYYFETALFDVGASLVMASAVGAVSTFLLQRSGAALLGRTLPMSRVVELIEHLEERPTISGVYDVKTEVLGTDTVRFKAEVQFNAEGITESILGIGRMSNELPVEEEPDMDLERVPVRLEMQLREMLPQAQQGLRTAEQTENWLHANNALFYEALAWEVKMVERQIRQHLKDFRNIHIDLEPW